MSAVLEQRPLELRREDWGVRDAGTTLRVLSYWWRDVLDGLGAADLERDPGPGTGRRTVRARLAASGLALDAAPEPERTSLDATLGALDGAADRHAALLLGPDRSTVDPEAATDLALAAVAPLVQACATLRALGLRTPATSGEVVQLASSDGGVPKTPIAVGEIQHRGLAGDRQRSKQHHGRVWQAVCLWSADVIAALRAEGHPIGPGSAGENVTVRGLDWPSIRPGVRLALGDEVLLEVSAYAVPCQKNARWFLDGDFQRMGQDHHPGWSRVYAWVVRPGTVRPGDEVTAFGAPGGRGGGRKAPRGSVAARSDS